MSEADARIDAVKAVRCPADGEAMERVQPATPGDVVVDRCPKCLGVWLDLFELEKLVGAGPEAVHSVDEAEALRAPGGGSPRTCPRDGAQLVRMRDLRQRHVELDRCSTCGGIFLDAGELRDLSEFTLGERVRRLLS